MMLSKSAANHYMHKLTALLVRTCYQFNDWNNSATMRPLLHQCCRSLVSLSLWVRILDLTQLVTSKMWSYKPKHQQVPEFQMLQNPLTHSSIQFSQIYGIQVPSTPICGNIFYCRSCSSFWETMLTVRRSQHNYTNIKQQKLCLGTSELFLSM